MAIDQQADEPIPLAVPLALQGSEQPSHFVLGQVLADSIGRVRAPAREFAPKNPGKTARIAGIRAEILIPARMNFETNPPHLPGLHGQARTAEDPQNG